MPQLNSYNCVGRLGGDPESRQAGSGNVTQVGFAVSRSWKNKDTGEWDEKTTWFRLKGWNYAGERIQKFAKGQELVVVNGSIEVEEWEKDGNKRQSTVIMVGPDTLLIPVQKMERQAAARTNDNDDNDLPF